MPITWPMGHLRKLAKMTAAFIVLAHGHESILRELLDELRPYRVFLHIDRSADGVASSILNHPPAGGHVVLNPDRQCVHWGGYSVVSAMMETLILALDKTDSSVNHFVFLSGQCFPLRPVAEFVDFLASDPLMVLCRARSLDGSKEMGSDRFVRRHWLDGGVGHLKKSSISWAGNLLRRFLALISYPFRVSAPDITHACGSQWVAIPRELARELTDHYLRGDFDYLTNSFAPDEVVIPTYVFNSPWSAHTPAGGLEKPPTDKVSSLPNFHWLVASMDGCVTVSDVDHAISSGAFFIRKMPGTGYLDQLDRIRASWT